MSEEGYVLASCLVDFEGADSSYASPMPLSVNPMHVLSVKAWAVPDAEHAQTFLTVLMFQGYWLWVTADLVTVRRKLRGLRDE